MTDVFMLTVPVGSVIHGANGSQVLNGVPENAAELWEQGSSTLVLKKASADEFLKDFSKARLEKVLELRRPLKMEAEIKLLEAAIKGASKNKEVTKDKTVEK